LKPKVAKKASKAKNSHKKFEENKKIQNPECDGNIDSQTCWSKVIEIKNLRKKAAFEIKPSCYMKALDNGTIRIGEAHAENEEPDDDEQFVVLPLSFGKFAFKSGFNKYLGLNGTGDVVAIADAVGSFESWEPVIENGKTALCGPNNKFLIEINSHFKCSSAKASEDNFLNIKSSHIEIVSNTDEYAEVSENRNQSDDFEKQLIIYNREKTDCDHVDFAAM